MLNHILMTVMQLMLTQIQHQAMRNSIGFSPSSVLCSIYFHDRAESLFIIQLSSDNPAPKLYTHPGYSVLISYVLYLC